MSLIERLQEAQADARPAFHSWLDALPTEDRKALENAAGNNGLSSKKLIGIVRDEGGSVGDGPFKEWRQGHGFTG
jgi:hypothetical protein